LIAAAEPDGMPIVVRRGRPVAEPRPRLLRFDRPVIVDAAATTIGEPATEPDDRHELARLALDLVLRTSEPIDAPRRWAAPAFGAEVDRTRAQLGPIRSRDGLLASYGREASIAATRGLRCDDGNAGPVRIAYAIRWLELGDGRIRPAWASILAGALRDVVGSTATGGAPQPAAG
jgi:hypothetical protein